MSFPNVVYKGVQVMPDGSGNARYISNSQSRSIIGSEGRTIVNNPYLLNYAKCNGRIQSEFVLENGETVFKHGTGFVFADNWAMTTAFNVYDPETDKFADRILFYPALGGNIENPVYAPVDVTRALIHQTIISYAGANQNPLYNIAFLNLDEKTEKPKGYCGFRYQYDSYDYEGVLLLGYPEDLPKDVENAEKGTYMYRGMGSVSRSDNSYIYHSADISKGYEGAPMLMYWGDGNGYVAIGINAYEGVESNVGLTIDRHIFGSMKMIRNNGMIEVPYSQPKKPDTSGKPNISEVFNCIKQLGEIYTEYKLTTSIVRPDMKTIVVGICNYLRHLHYNSIIWALALLDPIDTDFVEYVKSNKPELYNELNQYIREDNQQLKDSNGGVIDLPHFAATLEGYVGMTPSPDFWTGWGADLATGMAKTTEILQTNYTEDKICNKTITEISNGIIGAVDEISPCNYSDFCSDIDAIKIAQMIEEFEDFQIINGHEFANILEKYYTDLYKDRFEYIFLDLDCSINSDIETIANLVYNKMTGADEAVGLLTTFGNNPSQQVIQDCCRAMANYIMLEL